MLGADFNLNLSVSFGTFDTSRQSTHKIKLNPQYKYVFNVVGVDMRRKISMQKLMIWPTIQLSVPNKQCLFQWAGKLPPWPSNTTSLITWWSPFHMQNRLIQKLLISIKPTSKNRKTSTHSMPSALCIGHKKYTCNLDIFLESCISSDVFAIHIRESYI